MNLAFSGYKNFLTKNRALLSWASLFLCLILGLYGYTLFCLNLNFAKIIYIVLLITLTITCIVLLIFYIYQKEKINDNDITTRQLKKQQAKNQRDLEMARLIQQSLLGDHCFINKEIKVIANCRPAEKIGGDFYTFNEHNVYKTHSQQEEVKGVIKLQNQISRQFGVCIGDVAGHGIASALIMLLAKSLLDQLLQQNTSPAKIFQLANKRIRTHTEKSDISFVTAALMLINLDTKSLIYAKAGHTDSLLIKEDGSVHVLTAEGVFLGMFDNIEFEEVTLQLHPKEKMLLYTDGIIETRNQQGEIFGLKRLVAYLEKSHKNPLEKLITGIHDELVVFSGKQDVNDDATLILIEIM